ncbi:homeobox protein ATH1-like isoform X2 [Juglans microcarpa x Juglans regia]|uniref:homeobox protein ATH1-like isoform X2 n=1 Tax=Juglans microcarpa x Juglans regia TaxID=2249226 RepID=UPI001B7F3010|nr:homeobox protein ATH1-like isoform X2 [Juglans microcarpa x Juglans regia]
MMENNVLMGMGSQSPVDMDGFPPCTTTNALTQPESFDLNNQNHVMAGFPVLSALQGEPINGLHANLHIPSGVCVAESNALLTLLGRHVVRDATPCSPRLTDNSGFPDQAAVGTIISTASHPTFLPARSGLQENFNNLAFSAASICPLEVLPTYDSNGNSNALFATSVKCGYDNVLGSMNTKWDNKYPAPLELDGKSPVRAELQPYPSAVNLVPDGWMSSNRGHVTANHPYNPSNFNNELSLTLATSEPSILREINIPDRPSEMGMSDVTSHCLNKKRLRSQPMSCNSTEISLNFGSYNPPQFSQGVLGPRYLHVIKQIFAQIAKYSLENLDHLSYPTAPFSSNFAAGRWMPSIFPDVDGGFELQMESTLRRWTVEAKKTHLLTLLQVDDRCNQCMDEIHTVISAFHAATELDPQIDARFALQTISFFYKNLRERISNHILAMGPHFNSTCKKEKERSFETSFIQKQWALQQLKTKDHHIWRPQRGLPERSVSVLRAWMFQNFLHPYPKDAEKHLLAVKSGLTRSQVSNWFINARVRLWKPMIEEMYAEMNRRKGRRDEEGAQSNHRSHISISNRRSNAS